MQFISMCKYLCDCWDTHWVLNFGSPIIIESCALHAENCYRLVPLAKGNNMMSIWQNNCIPETNQVEMALTMLTGLKLGKKFCMCPLHLKT